MHSFGRRPARARKRSRIVCHWQPSSPKHRPCWLFVALFRSRLCRDSRQEVKPSQAKAPKVSGWAGFSAFDTHTDTHILLLGSFFMGTGSIHSGVCLSSYLWGQKEGGRVRLSWACLLACLLACFPSLHISQRPQSSQLSGRNPDFDNAI
jgi:hypothetical protein